MVSVTVGVNDAEQRLDKFLRKYMPALPQSLMYRYIRLKRIKVNGKKSEISYKLRLGDKLDLYINDEFFGNVAPNEAYAKVKPDITVVYEDENIILVDKKPGMLAHSDVSADFNTLIAHIQAYLFSKSEYNPEAENSFAPALCNRIDRNTGGIVIAAKNAAALRIMNEKIKNRELKKSYLCVLHGIPTEKEGTLRGYLLKIGDTARVYDTPTEGARTIVTKYKILTARNNLSLAEIELVTGRTHQIRAHMAHIGHPLAGDGKYGTNQLNKSTDFKHQALYAYRLEFDFKTSAGALDYLNGKRVTVQDVYFLREFGYDLKNGEVVRRSKPS
jgi:23S rRNA pseudouridine955/2504/2580 synthase